MTPHTRRSTGVITAVLSLAILGGVALAADAPSASAPTPDGVIAFYFHGNARCATCRTIEAYADEAVHQGFATDLEAGELSWRVVNIDTPENRHFIEDFQLVTRSVVLAEYRNGQLLRSKNLDQVWRLVRDKQGFVAYLQDETRAFLGAS